MTKSLKTASRWLLTIGLPMMVVTAVVAGQAQTPRQNPQTPQNPRFTTAIDAITTSVIVRGPDGQFVPDLQPGDFEVFEDGVRQDLTLFSLSVGGRITSELTPTPVRPTEGLILPRARPPTDASGRIFIIFIDDMHLQPSDSVRARRVLEQIRDELVHENDLIGLVSTGFSSIASDLTYDLNHRRFNEAIGKLMGSADTPTDILNMPESNEGVAKLRYNANVAFRTAYEILGQAAKVTNRRKSFIYVSSGYSFNPFKDSRYEQAKEQYEWMTPPSNDDDDPDPYGKETSARFENPFDYNGQQFAETDLVAQIAELTRVAKRANVAFYTIDPRGLDAGPSLAHGIGVSEWREYLTMTVSTLQILADETGGFAIVNTNDFRSGLRRIDAETSDYYIIGYVSSNPDPLRVRRQIEIRVPSREDLELQYTPEYLLDRSRRR